MNTIGLVLPGLGNSGPDHWQSRWERADPSFIRVQLGDWDRPSYEAWREVLEKSVARAGARTVLVAHSLACILVAHWARESNLEIKGALLVAPPNPDRPDFPREAVGFSPVPLSRLRFPSIVVASSDDPYGSLEFTRGLADAWGSRFASIGPAGHINADSGLGDWPDGLELFRQLAA